MAQKFVEAQEAAIQGGLSPYVRDREWVHLTTQAQLIGQYQPQIVMLGTARNSPHFYDIETMLYDREATIWSEMDLINGKVPDGR